MNANDAAVASFEELTAPPVTSGPGLTAALRGLEAVVEAAVSSLLGWSLTIKVDGACVTLTSVNPSATSTDVRASLRVPLSAFFSVDLRGGMVFYASTPHAFSRLTRDFVPTVGPALCRLRIDQDLNPDLASVLSGVRPRSGVSRNDRVGGGDTRGADRYRLFAAASAEGSPDYTAIELVRTQPSGNSPSPADAAHSPPHGLPATAAS